MLGNSKKENNDKQFGQRIIWEHRWKTPLSWGREWWLVWYVLIKISDAIRPASNKDGLLCFLRLHPRGKPDSSNWFTNCRDCWCWKLKIVGGIWNRGWVGAFFGVKCRWVWHFIRDRTVPPVNLCNWGDVFAQHVSACGHLTRPRFFNRIEARARATVDESWR